MSRLKSLALSEDGFAFDPRTGESFTTNKTGMFIIRELMAGHDSPGITADLTQHFDVDNDRAERDVIDFIEHLRIFKLM